jgi:hypothetical protein
MDQLRQPPMRVVNLRVCRLPDTKVGTFTQALCDEAKKGVGPTGRGFPGVTERPKRPSHATKIEK